MIKKFFDGDISLSFKKELVDAVYGCFKHVDNKNQTIQEIFRVMIERAYMCPLVLRYFLRHLFLLLINCICTDDQSN
jgi:hypothetical protein